MTIEIVFTGVFLLALALVLLPLWRYRADTSPIQNKNMAVYKAQLEELVTDQNNGALSPTEAAAARLEIERRLLKTADDNTPRGHKENTAKSPVLASISALIIMLLTVGFYLLIGQPHRPDFPLNEQSHSGAKQAEKNSASVEIIREVAEIEAHLITNPANITAWRALGQYQSKLNNRAQAAQAYQRWYELEPDSIEAAVIYGESLIVLSEGRVGPAALLVLSQAAKIQPRHPAVRHYLALAHYQSGNIRLALANWKALRTDSEANAPWLPQLRRWIRQAENDLGLETSALPAVSKSNRAAIQDMSAEEQATMIKGMVARLQAKMDKDPENMEGWLQLSRAYEVLGQKDAAIRALEAALKHAPEDRKASLKKQLEILSK